MAARLSVALGAVRARVGGRQRGRRLGVCQWVGSVIGEAFQVPFQFLIAFGNPQLVGIVQVDFLLQDKQEIGLPRAFEALGDFGMRGMDARVAQGRECLRVSLPREDRADNPLPRRISDKCLTISWRSPSQLSALARAVPRSPPRSSANSSILCSVDVALSPLARFAILPPVGIPTILKL
jgi:hypothetical protein